MAISRQEEKALFRFGIIFPLISMRPEDGPLGARIDEICSREHHIPHSTKTTLSPGTVREWYYTYKEKGTIDSLAPAGRSDRGKKRTISRESTDRLLAMRGEYPAMPVTRLVEKAVSEGVFAEDGVPSMSTIYAIMKEAACGYQPNQTDRRAYRAPSINDQWQSDAMHGPTVRLPNGKQAKAKLFCCLDNKSRLVCYAAWYGSETAVSYLDCLWNAFRLRGLPKNIYFDNGSSFRDARLKLGCASVGVNLVWARPYKPQGKGAIERWNRSVRDQFLCMLPTKETLTLDELNVRFAKWVDTYNHRVHSSLDGESPLQCYLKELKAVRICPDDLPKHFRRSETRLVGNDRTIHFMGSRLQAPLGYSGRKITLRFFDHDPTGTCEGFFNGASIGMLSPVDYAANYRAHRQGGGK